MTPANILDCIELETSHPVKASIIWLHGLGADGNDFVPIAAELKIPQAGGTRFIFPHAPMMPVTINNGFVMRAWYDILALSMDAKIDEAGMLNSASAVKKLIEREVARGISSRRIFLAGFSQGAVIALKTALSYPEPLAGVIALSGYLPAADKSLAQLSSANKTLPIFMAHGTLDPVVPFLLGKVAYLHLQTAGFPIEWHTYPMPHSVCPEEIKDLRDWLLARLQ